MKKLLHTLIFLTLFMGVGLLFSGCGECAHQFGNWVTQTQSTCSEEGSKKRICSKCGYVETGVIELSTTHLWDEGVETTPPKCGVEGVKTYTCLTNPAHTKQEPIPALEHFFSTEYTTDREPTKTQEGLKSRHCIREGCDGRTDEQVIPKLPLDPGEVDNSDGNITYRIKINRYNGYTFNAYAPFKLEYEIMDSEGNVIKRDGIGVSSDYTCSENEYAMAEVRLPIGEYKVRFIGIPQGFEYEESYDLSASLGEEPYNTPEKFPTLDIRLKYHPYEGELTFIRKRTLLPNFTMNTINYGPLTLNDILATKKFIIMIFYWNGCQYCQELSSYIKEVYKKYQDDIAVVCVNTRDAENTIINYAKSYYGYPDEFYFVCDANAAQKDKLYLKLEDHEGVPRTIFIDDGGFVCQETGVANVDWLERILKYNLFEMPSADDEAGKTFYPILSEDLDMPKKESYI